MQAGKGKMNDNIEIKFPLADNLSFKDYIDTVFFNFFGVNARQYCKKFRFTQDLEMEITHLNYIFLHIWVEDGHLRINGPNFHSTLFPNQPLWYRTQGRVFVSTIDLTTWKIRSHEYLMNSSLPFLSNKVGA